MQPRLELRCLRKSFDGSPVVAGIDLALAPGEFVSLLGPSGCGKSTTLAMIAGFIEPDAGEIRVDGRVVNAVAPHRRRLGLVFQDYAVFSRLTVRQNLEFGLKAQRIPRSERRRRLADISEQLKLADLMGRRGSALNMSEMQRLAIARVLVTQPSLLLLDEPMSNLDARLRAALRGELKLIQAQLGQTVLYVTHDQIEAMSMSDRIAVMRDGELLQVGAPEEIYHEPANRFVAEFIGDPPINIVPCHVSMTAGTARASTALHPNIEIGRLPAQAGSYLLGIRPHDAHLVDSDADGAASTTVRFVENLGHEHILHVDYGERLLAVAAAPYAAREGDTVSVRLDAARLHIIDPHSELVLTPERARAAA